MTIGLQLRGPDRLECKDTDFIFIKVKILQQNTFTLILWWYSKQVNHVTEDIHKLFFFCRFVVVVVSCRLLLYLVSFWTAARVKQHTHLSDICLYHMESSSGCLSFLCGTKRHFHTARIICLWPCLQRIYTLISEESNFDSEWCQLRVNSFLSQNDPDSE